MKKKTNWNKIFKLGDRIYLLMALEKLMNKQTKDSTYWIREKFS